MFCNTHFSYEKLERQIEDATSSCFDTFRNMANTISHEIKSILKDFGCFPESSSVHYGMIESVEYISNTIPIEYVGKCYHQINLTDGFTFQLICKHLDFERIKSRLVTGNFFKIIYSMPDFRIINLYPREYFQEMVYEDALDRIDIEDDQRVRLFYLEGQIKRMEFLPIEDREVPLEPSPEEITHSSDEESSEDEDIIITSGQSV